MHTVHVLYMLVNEYYILRKLKQNLLLHVRESGKGKVNSDPYKLIGGTICMDGSPS